MEMPDPAIHFVPKAGQGDFGPHSSAADYAYVHPETWEKIVDKVEVGKRLLALRREYE